MYEIPRDYLKIVDKATGIRAALYRLSTMGSFGRVRHTPFVINRTLEDQLKQAKEENDRK